MEPDTEEYKPKSLHRSPSTASTGKPSISEISVYSADVLPSQTPTITESKAPSVSIATSQLPQDVLTELDNRGLVADSTNTIHWTPTSPLFPRNWGLTRKIYNTSIIIFLEFFMTMISNTGSSIAPSVMQEQSIARTLALFSITTTYLLGQAFGGLILPPIAESFGGAAIYSVASFGFAVFCLVIGLLRYLPALIIGRFVTGFLSAMPTVVAAGSLEEMWDIRERIFVFNTWVSLAVVGLGIAPAVATSVCMSEAGWPAIFYGAAAVSAFVGILSLGMRESRPLPLLQHHVRAIQKKTGYKNITTDSSARTTVKAFLLNSLLLPVRLFFTEPIVLATSIMVPTILGVVYLFSEVLGPVYTGEYNLTRHQSSLVFLSLGFGVIFTFLTRIHDLHVTNREHMRRDAIEAEDKLFGFYVAAPVFAAALWWFGATVPPLTHVAPASSIVSLALIGFSVVEFNSGLTGYLTDSYTKHAASANAPLAFLRATLSGTFPLFGTPFFRAVGPNVASFILAGFATGFIVVAALFRKFGKRLRMMSRFARIKMEEGEDFAEVEKVDAVEVMEG